MKSYDKQSRRVSSRTKMIAVASALAVAISGCGKDNSSVHDIVLSCSDNSKKPKNFAVVNLDDNTNVKGFRSHRTDKPFNTAKARDSFPEDRSLSAAAILYECVPDVKKDDSEKTSRNNPTPPPIETPPTNNDRSVTLSLDTSDSNVFIGTKTYDSGQVFDGDIKLGPNTEGTLVYAVDGNGDEPNGNQAKLGINSVTGIYPDEVKFHSSDIIVNPPESPF